MGASWLQACAQLTAKPQQSCPASVALTRLPNTSPCLTDDGSHKQLRCDRCLRALANPAQLRRQQPVAGAHHHHTAALSGRAWQPKLSSRKGSGAAEHGKRNAVVLRQAAQPSIRPHAEVTCWGQHSMPTHQVAPNSRCTQPTCSCT